MTQFVLGNIPSTHIPNSIWILNVVNHLLAGVHILQDQEREREDQMCASRGDSRCCPNCGKVIEKNGGSWAARDHTTQVDGSQQGIS